MMLNVHELSKELGISESGIYQWISQRKIPFVKIGRTVRFDPEEISKWLSEKKINSQDICMKDI
jgi:excisionase family DNA binding protein